MRKSGSEDGGLHGEQMDEPKSLELLKVESWGSPPSEDRCKKFCTFPSEDELEYCVLDSRLTLSDDLKVGYFKTDRATQTDVSEILDIRRLSNTTQKLVKLTNLIQRDFKYLKTYLEMQFEDRLKEESMNLYKKLQMIIQELVTLHEKNEDTMRKSFYKQLCDAIASIRGAYLQFLEVDEEIAQFSTLNVNLFRKKLKDKNDIIRQLEEELASYKENESFKLASITEENNEKIAHLEKEISDLKKENEKLSKFFVGLEEDLQLCEKANTLLEGELAAMKQKMEKDQKMIQKLTLMKNKLSEDLDQEKRAVQDMYDQEKVDLEETRRLLEAEGIVGSKPPGGPQKAYYEERASVRPTSSSRIGPKETLLPGFMKEGTPAARSEQRRLERDDLIWKEATDGKQSLELQVRKLKRIMEMQRRHLKGLQMHADQESKMWERKYLILRNSLHALKDEMFTRQSFVRQFVTLSDASFNYYKAKPLYIQSKTISPGKDKPRQPTIFPHLVGSNHSPTSDDIFFFSMPTTSREVISEEDEDVKIQLT